MTEMNLSRRPPNKHIASVEYDTFTKFISNDTSKVSNTIEIWEAIPKYFLSTAQVEKLRTPEGFARSKKWEFDYNGSQCTIKIQPAEIEQEDGTIQAVFPGATEELVEEALKKIFSDQQNGIHDPRKTESWVKFSLRMIQSELAARNKTRDINQIKSAIDVMSSCILTLNSDGNEIWKGAILQDLITVGREEYLADSDAKHIARFPIFVSRAVNSVQYRQFNYDLLMKCKEQLSRWIYKKLINKFIQAGPTTTYHILFSRIEESGLLQQATASRNRQKVISALNELKARGVILKYEAIPKKQGRTIVDVKYIIIPSPTFISEQKAANKRKNIQEKIISKSRP